MKYGAAVAPSAGRVRRRSLSRRLRKSEFIPGLKFETEGTVESNLRVRRNLKKPYFQAKAQDLFDRSEAINVQLSPIEAAMTPSLNSWIVELNGAKAEVKSLLDRLERAVKAPNVVFDWIIDFAGSLTGHVANARRDADEAIANLKMSLESLEVKIKNVTAYRNDLASRQRLSQLRGWKAGDDLTGMIENVARSFDIDQRDMLQGWWDEAYLSDWKAIGDRKPWQPVCDLYQSLVTPRSWADIERWRKGSAVGDHGSASDTGLADFGAYGTVTPTGTVGTEGGTPEYVYFRQPRPGQAGYRNLGLHKYSRTDPWGKSLLQEGCVPGEACPVGAWTSPITRTYGLRGVQTTGLTLTTGVGLRAMMTDVELRMEEIQSEAATAKTKYQALWYTVKYVAGAAIVPQIEAALAVTGATAALTSALTAVGAVGGPLGSIIGALTGWLAAKIGASQIYSALISDLKDVKGKIKAVKDDVPDVKSSVIDAFEWWETHTTASWRFARAAEMRAVKSDLQDWIDQYDAMLPTCRYIYPSRNAAQWIRLGVPQPCPYRAPDFEDPGDWEPPEGGDPRDVEADKDEPMEVLLGSYGSIGTVEPKRFLGLTTKSWLIIGGLAVAWKLVENSKRR